MINDDTAVSYIHKGCCDITKHTCDGTGYCNLIIAFPPLNAEFAKDNSHGYNINCKSFDSLKKKTLTFSQQLTYPTADMTWHDIDCYTNKEETLARIETPFSELYASYRVGGTICACIGGTSTALAMSMIFLMCKTIINKYKSSY